MKKIYPVVENKYRFLGGWTDIPSNLHDLVVGRGYEITPSGKEYIIRGASKLILIDQQTKDKYFEPYIDYFAEPTIIEESEGARIATSSTITQEVKDNSLEIAYSNTDNDQLCLF